MKGKSLFNEYEIKANIRRQLSICKTIKCYKEIASTQTAVKKLAEKGFDEGIIIVSERQTKGYGRINRTWNSNVGGLWFSMLLKPLIRPDEVPKLTLLLSIALNRILERNYKVISQIKWPNDVIIYGKKIAGIIVEISAEQGATNWIVSGIGININNELPEDLKDTAISLKDILGTETDMAEFMAVFLIEFEKLYLDFQKNGFTQFLKEYNDKIAYKNELITIDNCCSVTIGKNFGIDEDGKLIVKTNNGFEKMMSGTLRKLEK
ncbi:MAG: biotin--[acetyl-CoA-carboxylase] ligase [Endomicrobium sp.]|nr:biotin--[acetyl-CoA-carboxylase] ligase [Endomicrobium sp.]